MTSQERVSRPISQPTGFGESYGRTDGLTENSSSHRDESEPPYRDARVQPESAATVGAAGFAASHERYDVVRRGEREPLCWHVRALIKRRDNYRCRRCNSQSELEVDHIFPYSAGGTHDTRNLQVLCAICNDKKSNLKDERAPQKRHAIVLTCLRCRENGAPTDGGERVWCLKCKADSHETPLRIGAVQTFLATHCDQVERPAFTNREAWGLIDYLLPEDFEKWRTERRKAREASPPRDESSDVPHPLRARLDAAALASRSDAEAAAKAAHRERVEAARAELDERRVDV